MLIRKTEAKRLNVSRCTRRGIGRLTVCRGNLLHRISTYDFSARFIFRSRTLNKKSRFSAYSFYSSSLSLSLFAFSRSSSFVFYADVFGESSFEDAGIRAEDTTVPAGIADKRELFNLEASQLSQLQDFPTE